MLELLSSVCFSGKDYTALHRTSENTYLPPKLVKYDPKFKKKKVLICDENTGSVPGRLKV